MYFALRPPQIVHIEFLCIKGWAQHSTSWMMEETWKNVMGWANVDQENARGSVNREKSLRLCHHWREDMLSASSSHDYHLYVSFVSMIVYLRLLYEQMPSCQWEINCIWAYNCNWRRHSICYGVDARPLVGNTLFFLVYLLVSFVSPRIKFQTVSFILMEARPAKGQIGDQGTGCGVIGSGEVAKVEY